MSDFTVSYCSLQSGKINGLQQPQACRGHTMKVQFFKLLAYWVHNSILHSHKQPKRKGQEGTGGGGESQ